VNTHQPLPPQLDAFVQRMPKVELHLHLEGAIRPGTLLALAERNGVEIPARDEGGVAQLFNYRSFHEFLTVFMTLARALVHRRDFEQAAYELGEQLAAQHVRYAEVMISPVQYLRRELDLDEVVQGAAAGLARAREDFGVRAILAFDFGRQFGVDLAWRVLEIAVRNIPHGVVAWSIGGDELNHPPEPFAEVYAAARRAGLRLMAHAGEVAGPESVRGAMDALGAERIGHGIRSVQDPALLAELRERRVMLDVSPTSNLRTGAVASLEEHPLRRLYEEGIRISINTDDPVFFGTSMCDELRLAARHFGFSAGELEAITLDGVAGSFLPAEEKRALGNELAAELTALRAELGV
jgi:adenosine deaminase